MNRVKWVGLKQDLFSGMRVGGLVCLCVRVCVKDINIPVNINCEYLKCFNFKHTTTNNNSSVNNLRINLKNLSQSSFGPISPVTISITFTNLLNLVLIHS